MRLILIDASNISEGGGKVLLEHLLDVLTKKQLAFVVILKKNTLLNTIVDIPHEQITFCDGPNDRAKILKADIKQYHPKTLLCFGNYPPPFPTGIETFTYFHNPHLLGNPIAHFKYDKFLFLRQCYLKWVMANTNYFIFQSNFIKDKFEEKFGKSRKHQNLVMPFYDRERIVKFCSEQTKKPQFIYVSLPHRHKNHLFLLAVWSKLQRESYNPKLLLTIPESKENHKLLSEIDKINSAGGQIINLGLISFEEAMKHTSESEFCIYPSLFETFGLGLIESALLGCKVLVAELPYVKDIVKPSLYLNPYDSNTVAESIINVLRSNKDLNKTIPLVPNKLEELIDILNVHG